MIDHTHDRHARSWVSSAHDHGQFPLQNLPLARFSREGVPRIGTAIGDKILDLRQVAEAGFLPGEIAQAVVAEDLKPLLSLGAEPGRTLRHCLFALLEAEAGEAMSLSAMLHDAGECELILPTRPGGYTDFYAGIVHATNVGRLLRPDNPLMPNYKYVPVGYHGRTSTISVSGTPVRRPLGQMKAHDAQSPSFGPSARLDYELELAFWIGEGNAVGEPIPIASAARHLAGVTLLNDWSARDIQAWEYQPLGPFLAKNFATTVSPWLVTMDALAPFRVPLSRPEEDPSPLPYLDDAADRALGGIAIDIEVALRTAAMRASGAASMTLGRTSSTHLYWTPAQLVAHHTSNGCALESGDMLGTGTISAPRPGGFGSLMEITRGGAESFEAGGALRRFIEDGDEIVMTARCQREGFASIGFGECRSIILPSPPMAKELA